MSRPLIKPNEQKPIIKNPPITSRPIVHFNQTNKVPVVQKNYVKKLNNSPSPFLNRIIQP